MPVLLCLSDCKKYERPPFPHYSSARQDLPKQERKVPAELAQYGHDTTAKLVPLPAPNESRRLFRYKPKPETLRG